MKMMEVKTNGTPLHLDDRYAAIMRRDARADGAFVYGVTSTGIFCRPSCASRRPRLDRIAFFGTPAEARRAGFRACRRCEPEAARVAGDLAARVCRYIDEHGDDVLDLRTLGSRFGVSPRTLVRNFQAATGMTPKAYANLRRVERLKHRLRDGKSVTTALYDVGYGSSSRLYEGANNLMGMTPSEYRRHGAGTNISFALTETSLGTLLVAATERGICAVKLGNLAKTLEAELRAEYPAATVRRDDSALLARIRRIAQHIEDGTPLGQLATDVQGTAFTRAVWKALTSIPRGETRTYTDIATQIGRPTAARAVARACATNQLAIIVPCHRVVPAQGGTGGYRWGPSRKRALLQRESAGR